MDTKQERLKAMLLDMLAWFHGFCLEHELRYYVLGGTMLGAVRHGGFIPWDDDIDIGMPRRDYLRLGKLLKEEAGGRYLLETPETESPDFFYLSSKLYDTRTTLVEHTRYRIRRGIFLDIFPLDGAGNSREEALALFAPIRRKRELLLTLTAGIRRGRSLPKNLAVCLMHLVPEGLLSKKGLLRSIDKMCRQRDFDDCLWFGNLVGNWMERELMPRSCLGEPTEYPFGSLRVFGPQRYDEYLTNLYGNWRQLPPEEKRKSHHDFLLLDLETPWRED